MADGSGALVQINGYDAFGVPNSSNVGRFQYTGQTWIAELGLYHYKARFYSPALGRFMQTDPIAYDDNYNLYAYVANDPVGKTDPTGLAEIELGLEAEVFIGGGIKLGGSVSLDTTTLQIGAKGTFGIGGGASIGIGIKAQVSPTQPGAEARSSITTSSKLSIAGNLGPVSATKEVPLTENGVSVIPRPDKHSASVLGELVKPATIGLKPQLKAGASASVDYSAEATSTALAEAVATATNAATEVANRVVQTIICPPGLKRGPGCG